MCAVCGERLRGMKQAAAVVRRTHLRHQFVPRFRTELRPHLTREVREARTAVRQAFGTRDAADFDDWVERFYPGHERRMARGLLPLVLRYGTAVTGLVIEELGSDMRVDVPLFARRYARGLASRWMRDSLKQLRALIRDTPKNLDEEILGRLDTWETARVDRVAQIEATQANGAFSKHAYLLAGVTELRWNANADACPLCQEMDGRVVEITRPFLEEGGELTAGEGEEQTTLVTEKVVGHPPLHGMGGKGGVCQCNVSAA